MKYQELNEDSFQYKKEIIRFEKENKVHKEIIEKLRNEVLEDKQNLLNYNYEAKLKEYNSELKINTNRNMEQNTNRDNRENREIRDNRENKENKLVKLNSNRDIESKTINESKETNENKLNSYRNVDNTINTNSTNINSNSAVKQVSNKNILTNRNNIDNTDNKDTRDTRDNREQYIQDNKNIGYNVLNTVSDYDYALSSRINRNFNKAEKIDKLDKNLSLEMNQNLNTENNNYRNDSPLQNQNPYQRKLNTSRGVENAKQEDTHNYRQIQKRMIMRPEHISTDMSMVPSQKAISEKEIDVREVEVKLCEVQKVKERIENEIGRMPAHPKTKDKINKKIELEQNLQDILKEVSKYKHALRELNAVNRDY